MKIKYLVMGIIASLLSMFMGHAQSNNFRSVDVEEFEKVLADTAVVRLDVRTAEEFSEGHIEGTLNIDVLRDDFEEKAFSVLNKEKIVALYCRSGRRSKHAAALLTRAGYKVVELSSGYLGWKGAGKPVVE